MQEEIKTDRPLISIVLPTYNGARFLRQSAESCQAQTYPNWELIVVDDCSTDETPEIVAQYTAADPRIKSIRNRTNQRLPKSLNIGFAAARGSLFTWTSDDNVYEPTALAVMAEKLEEGYDLVYADQAIIDDEGKEIDLFKAGPPETIFDDNVINACFLYRREVHEALGGYDPDRFLIEDWHFWIRAALQFKMAVAPGKLYRYRKHEASLSTTRHKQVIEQMIRVKMEMTIPRLPADQAVAAYMALADQAYVVDNVKLRRALVRKAFRTDARQMTGTYLKWGLKHLLNRPIPNKTQIL